MKKFFTLLVMMGMLAFSSQAAYYIVGNVPFGNWNPAAGVEMTQNSDGTYTFTAPINGAVWFVFSDGLDSSWDTFNANYRIGPTGSADEEVTVGTWVNTQKAPGGSKSYKFTGTGGDYVFTFDPANMKFKVEGYVAPIVIDTYTVAGAPASVFGTEWDPENTNNDMVKLEDGTYELKKYGCELAEGSELQFKIVGNHSWDNCWPADNMVVPISSTGAYDIEFYFNPEALQIGCHVTKASSIDVRTGDLFILGEVNGNGWDPSNGFKMDTEDQNIFTAQVTIDGQHVDENDGIAYNFFSFTSKLGENAEDWASIAPYRLGSLEDGYQLSDDMMGIDIMLSGFGGGNSFRLPAGTFDLTVNLDNMTLVVNRVEVPELPFKFEKIWEVTDLATMMNTADVRQGFGMNSKFYINDKATQTIYVIGKNGLTTTTYPGGANCGLTRDEAGNLVVSNATFPDPWSAEATIKVINPETNEMKEYIVPTELGLEGRCDFLGFAKGNLMEDGVIYLTGATTNGVCVMTIAGGEVNVDECYAATCDGLTPTSSTVINYFKDLAGEDALLYVTRNAAPQKLAADGENFVATPVTLPGKGACNGMVAFNWDEKEYFAYPQEPNYQNAFAIAENGAEEPLVAVPSTVTGNANAYQADWLNAEVDKLGVTIYQYYPGGNCTVYRLTKNGGEPEPTNPPVITTETTEDGVVITVTGDGEIHVYVDGVEVENPYTIPFGDEEQTVTVTATAQGDGMGISETTTLVVVIPAKPTVPGDGYKIEKIWDITDLSFLNTGDVRQGFGMNSKFYVNDKATQTIYVIGKNGLSTTTYPGGANCGLTRDEAGNLVVSNATFPDPWSAEATIKVINPETNEMKEYVVPAECGLEGRCDFLGFAKGNLMEDGFIYLAGGTTTSGVAVMSIAGGEVVVDDCFLSTCDGLTPSTSTVINYYKDLAGEEALLYVTRNAALMKLTEDGENLAGTAFTLPNKGACNGTFPFIWDEKEFFVYPTLPNYQNGFAVAEASAEAPIVEIESTVTANANAFTSNWLNAEVDEAGVTIYQYYPGGCFAVYRLTKNSGGVEELNNDVEKVVAGVRYYNIMGQEMTEANGLTIVVTTYTDGSHSAVKVIK